MIGIVDCEGCVFVDIAVTDFAVGSWHIAESIAPDYEGRVDVGLG